jgi:hypothetical protein
MTTRAAACVIAIAAAYFAVRMASSFQPHQEIAGLQQSAPGG